MANFFDQFDPPAPKKQNQVPVEIDGNIFDIPVLSESDLYNPAPPPPPAPSSPPPPQAAGVAVPTGNFFDQFDQPPVNADPWTGIKYGATGAAQDFMTQTAGMTKFFSNAIDPYIPDILPDSWTSPSESAQQTSMQLGTMKDAVGFVPSVEFSDVLENPLRAARFIAEQAPVSLPYLAAATSLPGNIFNLMSITGNVASERAANKGEAFPSGETAIEAAPAGLASMLLERLGLEKILRPAGGNWLRRIFGAGFGEAATEVPQEVTEYAGATLGTDQKFEPAEAAKRGGAGGLVGFGTGAALRTPVEVAGAMGASVPGVTAPTTSVQPPAGAAVEDAGPVDQVPQILDVLQGNVSQPAPPYSVPDPAVPVQNISPDTLPPALPVPPPALPAEPAAPPMPEDLPPKSEEIPPAEDAPAPEPGDYPAGYFTPQDADEATPAGLTTGVKRVFLGDQGVSDGALYLQRGIDPEYEAALERRPDKLKVSDVERGADADARLKPFIEDAAPLLEAAVPFQAQAVYDPALAGRSGDSYVVGTAGDTTVRLDAKYYDYLVNRRGFELRLLPGAPDQTIFAIMKDGQPAGYVAGHRGGASGEDMQAAAALAPNALSGPALREYVAQKRPGVKRKPAEKPVKSLDARQMKAATAAKSATMKQLQDIISEGRANPEKSYPEGREIVIQTPSGQKTTIKLDGNTGKKIAANAVNLLKEIKGRKTETFYSQLPEQVVDDRAVLPAPAPEIGAATARPVRRGGQSETNEASPPPSSPPAAPPADKSSKVPGKKKPDGFRARLLSLRQNFWLDAGIDPDIGENMPSLKQFKLAEKIFKEKFNLEIKLGKGADMAAALNNIKDLYVELQTLANILKLPNAAIGLKDIPIAARGGGKLKGLKLVFTDQRRAGYLGAHVRDMESGDTEIRLPGRFRSLAHEYGHALDFAIMDVMGVTQDALGKFFRGYSARVRREGVSYEADNVAEAYIDFLNTIFFDESFAAAKIMELEAKIARARSPQSIAQYERQIEEVRRGNYKGKDYRSPFFRKAEKLPTGADKGYWKRPTEMVARSFEAWVQYRAQKAGLDLDLIAARKDIYTGQSGNEAFDLMYPDGPDRARIFTALDNLMRQLAAQGVFNMDQAPAARPLDESRADPMRWFREIPGFKEPPKTIMERVFGTAQERADARRNSKAIFGLLRDGQPLNPTSSFRMANHIGMLLFSSTYRQLRVIEARYNSPALSKAVNAVYNKPGSGEFTGTRFGREETLLRFRYLNRVHRIIKSLGLSRHNKAQMDALADLMWGITDAVPASLKNKEAALIKAAGGLREIYNEIYGESRENFGLDIGYLKDDETSFINRVEDMAKIVADPVKARAAFSKAYMAKYEKEIAAGELDPEKDFKEWGGDMEAAAQEEADFLVNRLILSDDYERTFSPPSSRISKRRSFPGEADTILRDFRISNPVDALEIYIKNISARAVWTKLLEPKEGDFRRLFDDILRETKSETDTKLTRRLILSAVGRNSQFGVMEVVGDIALSVIKILDAVMLGRMPFASLPEVGTVGLRTGNALDALRAWQQSVKEIWNRADSKDREDILQAWGIIESNLASMSMAERSGGTYGNNHNARLFETQYYTAILAAPLTDFQRKVAVRMGQIYFTRIANAILNPDEKPANKKAAQEEFREMGIADGEMQAFAEWLIARDGRLPDIEKAYYGANDRHESEQYAKMLAEFSWDVISRPENIHRPYAANTFVGKIMFGFLSVTMRFYEMLIKRQGKIALRKFKEGDVIGAAEHFALRMALPWFLFYLMSTGAFTLKTLLLNRAAFEDMDDEKKPAYLAKGGFTYSMPFGPLADIVYNQWARSKYNKDLSSAFMGKAGYVLDALQAQFDLFNPRKNSKNTDATERSAVEAGYRLTAMPALALAVGAAPIAGPGRTALGIANMWAGSRDAQESLSDAVFGPEPEKKSKRKKDED